MGSGEDREAERRAWILMAMTNLEYRLIWTMYAIGVACLVARGLFLLHHGPRKPAEPETSVTQASHRWLRWRWIPVALLYLFGGFCLFEGLIRFVLVRCTALDSEYLRSAA